MMLRRGMAVAVMGAMMLAGACAWGQASKIPSAQAGPESQPASGETSKGRQRLDAMVKALGGDAWLNREDWSFQGRAATFYKGMPHEEAPQFEEYYRAKPFGERIIIITHSGVFIATDHKDLAEVWTSEGGFEITYKGTHPLPEKDVKDYMRRHAHSLETVVHDWLKQPETLVTFEGTTTVGRRLAEQVSVITAKNDAVTIALDESTHLPLSISFEWRDPVYKDINKDVEEMEDYHEVQGIWTPYSVTYLHNGDMTQQRFFTKIAYNTKLPADLFDPQRPLMKKVK
jgi:hypothetical protein